VIEPLRTEPVAAAGADTRAAVRVVDAVKIYGTGDTAVRALDGVSVEVPRGQFLAIMGPSGSGKSTLLHCAAALDRLTSGTIEIDGTPLEGLSDARLTRLRRGQVGFVFQAYNLVPTLTARENITLPLDLAGEDVDAGWFDRIVDTLAIGDRLRHTPAELSGGQQQRVAAARALVSRPTVVFADEPTGALDSRSGAELLGFLRDASRTVGQTIVMVTHDPMAASYADRLLFLGDGRVVDELLDPTAEDVLDRMKHLEDVAPSDRGAAAGADDRQGGR
jgi:putative ABC transport system ATP-binding protein